ncbi:Nucleoporin nup132 [Psilocybe cubensis]|uniref:Uncharacterized protein n=2 Tax=Psilocybe cubensis TaxID=181762 RepID=A0A8H7Y0X1_PSICU|nr:Nucleoporin nup132 [Psilocybe cubensis]KAH9484254.1 Nucleoporin nup132 [Psilocybe cubensis]
MATFSPSPAPRRSSRLHTRGNSPVRSQRPHRLAAEPTLILNDSNSVASAMDIDERSSLITDRSLSRIGGEMIFAKTEEMSVSFYANLPLEVKQVLRLSDFNRDLYSGEIDTTTGFALVASAQTCFVWQHAQAIKGIPTCYIFSCPEDGSQTPKPPFHALVPQGSSREPGLILVSVTGQIRFWDSIGIGLAGGDNYISSQVENMNYEEEVTNLIRVDAQTYILSTSFGVLHRIVLTSAGGKYHLTIRGFARPSNSGTFSRLLPSFLSSSASASYDSKGKAGHIHAVALGTTSTLGDRDVWALANGRIQRWIMRVEGWEELVLDLDLTQLLLNKVQEKLSANSEDVEISDIAIFEDQNIALLISYSGKDVSADDFQRLYALAELKSVGNDFSVKHLYSVPYQTTSKPGPPVHPRIQLIYSGSIISVQFGDAVALCARGSEYRDRLELKGINDRTLGVGVSLTTNLLLILTANTMMKVSLDLDKIQSFRPETGHTALVKSIMMQAIIYGPSPLNPLRFSFPPELSGDALMNAAQQLSDAVMKSDSEIVRQSPDMTIQMQGRKDRLSWLISFINENTVLDKMTQASRQRIATDSEKLFACHKLWIAYNQSISHSSVLKDAVVAYMQEIGDDSHEDLVRAFFRTRVSDIGNVLQKVSSIAKEAAKRSSNTLLQILPEANRIVISVLHEASKYRDFNWEVYGLESPMIGAWTSRSGVIDSARSLFDLTTEALKSDRGPITTVKEPSSQFPGLAKVLLECVKERIEWLALSTEPPAATQVLYREFSELRPKIFETLRQFGHQEAAFKLAERYNDYTSLVLLSHQEIVYPPHQNPHTDRIKLYIQKYGEDFTSELFRWYIQNGEVRTMFDQEAPAGRDLLNKYFENQSNRNIAITWINDLENKAFALAASDLFQDAQGAPNLEGRHLMLSIGKLSYLAHMQETNFQEASTTSSKGPSLDDFHDALDFVSVLEKLVQDFRSVLVAARARQSIESQINTIIKEKGRQLDSRVGFVYIFKDLLRTILKGDALSVEDTVDILTLKDNTETVEDFATSLHVLSLAPEGSGSDVSGIRGKIPVEIPARRKESALHTIWRRIYLQDDWDALKQTADVSDDELMRRYQETAMFQTIFSMLMKSKEELIVDPESSLSIPSTQEISSRWPGMSSDHINALIQDYTWEKDRVESWDLSEIYDRIKQLAEEEADRRLNGD